MEMLHVESLVMLCFYVFMHPSATVLPFRLLKRMQLFMIQMTKRIPPCRYTLYIIDGIMVFAIGFVPHHRQSGTISQVMERNTQSALILLCWPLIFDKKLYGPVEVVVVQQRVPSRSHIARSAKQC